MQKRSVALFLFAYGTEARQFIYSGFLDELKMHYKVVIATRILSANLIKLSQKYDFELIQLPLSKLNNIQKFVFGKADAVFFRAYPLKNKFSYFEGKSNIKNKVKFQLIYKLLLPCVNYLERIVFTLFRDRITDSFFEDLRPQLLIVNLPRSPYFLRYLFQAKRFTVTNVLVFNTIKEVDANGRISAPIDHYFTWNELSTKELLQFNRNISATQVFSVGSPYYDRKKVHNRKKDNKHLLYCAANPKSIKNELLFVKHFIKGLKQSGILEDTKLIIRPNPMDDDFSRWDLLLQFEKVEVMAPKWVWNSENNWNEALEDDLEIYNYLLLNAKVVVGSASTVAIDAVVAGKKFLCIADNFWPDEIKECNFRYFSEAENFKLVKQSTAVECLMSYDDMNYALSKIGDIEYSPTDMPAVKYDVGISASRKIVCELLKGATL